jgi:hypothetical protein
MPYDPISGTWVDDATGVPDAGMPPGMGDFTGAPTPPPQATPMVPQQINPRPMPGAAFTPSAVDTYGNPLQAPPIPPPLTDPQVGQQIRQGFQQLDRPSMSPGNLAATILKAPLTVPLGIVEELRGLLGGETIEGWAQQARSRYNDPNFTESRAFGVQGPAEEPGFGDRFTGIVTGSAQRGAMAGKIIRQQVGAYNAQRKAALRENKDVQQLQLGDISLQKGTFDVQTQKPLYDSLMAQREEGLKRSQLGRAKTGLEMDLLGLNIGEKQRKQQVAQWIDANIADPVAREALYQKYGLSDLLGSARVPGGALPELQRGAIAAGSIPQGPSMLTPEQEAEAARKLETAARLEAAAAAQDRNRQAQRNTAVDLSRGQRDPVGPNVDFLQELLGRVSGGSLGIPSEAQDFADYDAETRRMQAEAYRSRGLPVPANLVAPTATPVLGATPNALVDRIDTMTPEDKAIERLQRETEAQGAPAVPALRPTPMATPMPQTTTRYVDLDKAQPEATRQMDAKRAAELKETFLLNWVQHEGWKAPRSGSRWDSKWSAFAAANGL